MAVFSIKFNSGVPIYRQVVEQVVRQIDRGQIAIGDLLPSVRTLASELGVNPMTVSKAYSILESDSVVERKRGVGMVVIKRATSADRFLKPSIQQLVDDAQQLGLTRQQLLDLIREHWQKQVKK